MTTDPSAAFIQELMTVRGTPGIGGNPESFISLVGGKAVEVLAWEPDPNTFRDKYYYNTTSNNLFKLEESVCIKKFKYRTINRIVKFWKLVTEN